MATGAGSTTGAERDAAGQIRGSSLLAAGRVLSVAVNFATQVLVVRYLSKADYGAFAYALSVVLLGETLVHLGMDRAVPRFASLYDEQRRHGELFGALLLEAGTILSLGLAAVVLVHGLRGWLAGSVIDDRQVVGILLILIVLAPIQALDDAFMGLFAVFGNARAIFFRRHVLEPGLRFAVLALVVASRGSVTQVAAGYVAVGLAGLAAYGVLLVRLLRRRGLLAHFHWRTLRVPYREVLGFSIPLLSSDLVYLLATAADALLVGHWHGAGEVAALRVIQSAAQANLLVSLSFTPLFLPLATRLFTRGDLDGVRHLYWQTAMWIAVLSLPVFAVTFALAAPVTVALYGSRYGSSATYLAVLSLGLYVQAASGFNGLTLQAVGRLRYVVAVNVAGAVANLALALMLIPPYGALGAAISTSATILILNALKQAGLYAATGISILRWRYLKVYALAGTAVAVLWGVQRLAAPPLAVGLGLAGLAWLAVLGLSRAELDLVGTFPQLARVPGAGLLSRASRP